MAQQGAVVVAGHQGHQVREDLRVVVGPRRGVGRQVRAAPQRRCDDLGVAARSDLLDAHPPSLAHAVRRSGGGLDASRRRPVRRRK
ncbi:hypothetical protein [Nocardioides plantarum]|uniref:hypothetical protein n=1 Tax=Nocardioides plantarum TaxID=29299 RepID=UPI003605C44F